MALLTIEPARNQALPRTAPAVTDGVFVWSCGKDRRDDGGAEGSDDITSWR